MTTDPFIPGSRDRKLQLLSGIDETRFPDLVCDVLYFCRGYRNLKVVDGPGDGRRDIRGNAASGEAVLVQCKFHRDWAKAVASRETDEIVIALSKFGVRSGVFATTGRLSPQAAREYEHNFPGYALSFLDGENIVDAVFGHPVLREVWTRDDQIDLNVTRLIVPMLLRNTLTDKPISAMQAFDSKRLEVGHLRVRPQVFDEADFAPYRAPSAWSLYREALRASVDAFALEQEVCVPIRELASASTRAIEAALGAWTNSCECAQIRFGRLRMGALGSEDPGILVQPAEDDGVEPWEINPVTYVLASGESSPVTEEEWVVPPWNADWAFPKDFGSLEADWVGWFNARLSCVLIPHLVEPLDPRYDGSVLIHNKIDAAVLEQSLFWGCSGEMADAMLAELPSDMTPDWTCRGVATERVLGWFHPARHGGFVFLQDESYGIQLPTVAEASDKDRPKLEQFELKKRSLESFAKRWGLRRVRWEDAVTLSQLSGDPLLWKVESVTHRSAYLYHYFDMIPSPLRLTNRCHVFVQVWDIPTELEEFQDWQDSGELDDLDSSLWVNPKYGHISKKFLPMFSVKFPVPHNVSVSRALSRQVLDAERVFAALRERIIERWPGSCCATEFFWTNEACIMFSKP